MSRINKTYRMTKETLDKIEWLRQRLGVSATDILALAIAEMYEQRKKAELRLKAVPAGTGQFGEALFDLLLDGKKIGTVNEPVLKATGQKYYEALLGDGAPEYVLGAVFLAAGLAENAFIALDETWHVQ
ncbi:MAG: hypothetical protein HPY45_09860 [Anaerolineae bacterium]|nr:hypothetical protein [Anaerolineae bacterium]